MSVLIDDLLTHEGAQARLLRAVEPAVEGRAVVYWMQRAQRAVDNPALDAAVRLANAMKLPLVVFFGLRGYPAANLRHYAFMLQGLRETARRLERRNIAFVLRKGEQADLARFCKEIGAAAVIGDENPLREPQRWRAEYAERLEAPFLLIDADVIVPSALLLKEQYSARIIRPRLKMQLPAFLHPLTNPACEQRFAAPEGMAREDVEDARLLDDMGLDASVAPSERFLGGSGEAQRRLSEFVLYRCSLYPERHGAPELEGTSELSPYLHFGQISPVTVALAVMQSSADEKAKEDYLDQLITWRELAINFVTFNARYDSIESAPDWARATLDKHARDEREFVYEREAFEHAHTHDELWNAAQRQMVECGWMHNYMRMYWAKKILEWSPSAESAWRTAVYLNDKYQLDGRDPNGYAGVAWAIGGKFDRPWAERAVYGTIRYMTASGCERKFDVKSYVRRWRPEGFLF